MNAKPTAQFWRHPAARLAGSALILGVLLAFVPLRKLGMAWRNIPATVWLSLVFGYLATHLIGVIKWRLTLRLGGATLAPSQAIRCYFAGLFGTVFLPSIVGGNVIRMGLAFRHERNKAGILLGSLMDRFLGIIALAVVAGIGVFLLPGALDPRSHRVLAALAVASGLSAVALSALLAVMPWRHLPYKMRWLFIKLRRAGRSMASKPLYFLVSLQLGIVVQICLAALSASVAAACGLHVPFRIWLLVWPLAKLLALIPITLGGLGIREAGLVALLVPFSASAALTVAAGLSWESIIIAGGLVAGSVSFLIGRRRLALASFTLSRLGPLPGESALSSANMSSINAGG